MCVKHIALLSIFNNGCTSLSIHTDFSLSFVAADINMYDVWYILETLTPAEKRYLNVLDNGLISAYHVMVRMKFILLSCTGECGWRPADIHSSLCLDRALGLWFWAWRLFLCASQMYTSIQWATHSPCHYSGCIVWLSVYLVLRDFVGTKINLVF